MSVAFVQRGNRPPPNTAQIQKMLDENSHLIQTIQEYQSKGQINECIQYQQTLHRNLVYLASIADSSQNIQNILPPPQVQSGGPQPNQPIPHVAVSEAPGGQNNSSNYPQPQQAYRGGPNAPTPNAPRPAGAPQQYNQRGYNQNQYQYQNMPGGAYPPQTQSGYMNPTQHSYGPAGSQPQGYPANTNYGPPNTTAQNSNYPGPGHQGGNYPPSPLQQSYPAPAPGGTMPAGSGPYAAARGGTAQNYSGTGGFQGPPMGASYGGPSGNNASSANYSGGNNQNSSYPSQQFPSGAPPAGYPSVPATQPNHSPQAGAGYPNQAPGSVSYGPPAAQSPTYSTSSNNPQNGGTQPPSTNVTSQAYPPGQGSAYSSSPQPPFSNPSQPGSPVPSNYQAPVSQPSNSTPTNSQGYAPTAPQSYSAPAGSYPPHAYGSHPQPPYPPSQYPNASYQYSRPPAPQPPPPQGAYAGYNYQPPAQ